MRKTRTERHLVKARHSLTSRISQLPPKPMKASTLSKAHGLIKTIAMPLSIFLTALFVTKCTEDRKTDQQYVQLAINILSEKTAEEADPSNPSLLRKWAVSVLSRFAPVNLSKEEQRALESGATQFPRLRNGNAYLQDSSGRIVTDQKGNPIETSSNNSRSQNHPPESDQK